MSIFQNELYLSGPFDSIGGVPYAGVARYRDTITSVQENNMPFKLFEIHPNPTSNKLEINISSKVKNAFRLIITDATGKTVMQNEYFLNPTNIILNLPDELSNGVYTCQIYGEDFKYSEQFVVQH